jgi:hypothetical protein
MMGQGDGYAVETLLAAALVCALVWLFTEH